MTDTSKFGGYIAVPQASGDALLVAWWTDGRAAIARDYMDTIEWHPLPTPDYAALWPAPEAAPVVADAPEVRYGTRRADGRWDCTCTVGRIALDDLTIRCRDCGDRNPALRPPPHRRAVDRIDE